MNYTIKGVDLSHHNKITDYKALNSLAFVIHKATQGTSYLDTTYKDRMLKISTFFGSYHFADGKDPIQEAEWYLKNANDKLMVLDWEIEHADPVGWSIKFLDRVKSKTGRIPYWYSNDARAVKYADKIPYPKWVARYGVNNGTPSKEPAYANWTIWQYTSRGAIAGVIGNVDLNYSKISLNNNEMSDKIYHVTTELEEQLNKISGKKRDYDKKEEQKNAAADIEEYREAAENQNSQQNLLESAIIEKDFEIERMAKENDALKKGIKTLQDKVAILEESIEELESEIGGELLYTVNLSKLKIIIRKIN